MDINRKIKILTELANLNISRDEESIVLSMPGFNVVNLPLCKAFAAARKIQPLEYEKHTGRGGSHWVAKPDALSEDPQFKARVLPLSSCAKDFSTAVSNLYAMATRKNAVIEHNTVDTGDRWNGEMPITEYYVFQPKQAAFWVVLSQKREESVRGLRLIS